MSAYLIFTREKTLDQKELDTYHKLAASTLAGHPGRPLAMYGTHEDLEGAPTEGTVIAEFPTADAAKAWYNSPAYKEVREHRFKGAKYHVILIQGV
jgi:uncharacterized protein (DUF1330 family)